MQNRYNYLVRINHHTVHSMKHLEHYEMMHIFISSASPNTPNDPPPPDTTLTSTLTSIKVSKIQYISSIAIFDGVSFTKPPNIPSATGPILDATPEPTDDPIYKLTPEQVMIMMIMMIYVLVLLNDYICFGWKKKM